MKLDDWLATMDDSGEVVVTAKQLRKYTQLFRDYERSIKQLIEENDKLVNRLYYQENKINELESELLPVKEPLHIDLEV